MPLQTQCFQPWQLLISHPDSPLTTWQTGNRSVFELCLCVYVKFCPAYVQAWTCTKLTQQSPLSWCGDTFAFSLGVVKDKTCDLCDQCQRQDKYTEQMQTSYIMLGLAAVTFPNECFKKSFSFLNLLITCGSGLVRPFQFPSCKHF